MLKTIHIIHYIPSDLGIIMYFHKTVHVFVLAASSVLTCSSHVFKSQCYMAAVVSMDILMLVLADRPNKT